MTDVRKIRGLVAELVDAAPAAPPLDAVPSADPRASRRRHVAVLAAISSLAAAAAVIVAFDGGDESRVQLGGRPTAPPAVEEYEKPTFVVPSRLPAGFELVAAGSDTSRRMGAQEIVFWSEDFMRAGRVVWDGPDGRCPPARRRSVAISQQQAIEEYRSAPASTASAGTIREPLRWCDPADAVMVTVVPGRGLSREETADVAEGIVRKGEDLLLSLPPGFTAVRTPEDRDLIRLLYRGPGGTDLWVDVWGRGLLSLESHRVDSENPASWQPMTLGGRPALKGDHVVTVRYDEHTLVDMYSLRLAESDLLAAAASLVPGDPSVPTPVVSDRSLCKRLDMC
jgi:hypothetical protein